jgi:hypothetical protein
MPDDEVPALDPNGPDWDAYAFQHDLRERFLHALMMIIVIEPSGRAYKDALARAQEIASEAIDTDTLAAWGRAGRPLPWIDGLIGEDASEVERVLAEFRA